MRQPIKTTSRIIKCYKVGCACVLTNPQVIAAIQKAILTLNSDKHFSNPLLKIKQRVCSTAHFVVLSI